MLNVVKHIVTTGGLSRKRFVWLASQSPWPVSFHKTRIAVAARDITASMSASRCEIVRQCAVRVAAGLIVNMIMSVSSSSYITVAIIAQF
jgi:hypothetical protein